LSTAEVPKVENSTLMAPVKAEKEEQNPVESEANKVAAPQIIPSVNSDANSTLLFKTFFKCSNLEKSQLLNLQSNNRRDNLPSLYKEVVSIK